MGKIRDAWKKAKEHMTAEQAKKLPKEDLGPDCDTYETLCNDLATKLNAAAEALDKWNTAYVDVNTKAGHYGTEAHKANLPDEVQTGLADLMRSIRTHGQKVHIAWTKVKDAEIKKYHF
jgi:methionine synthase II (cobalamin-independent)